MSDFRAIATVTAALRTLLTETVPTDVAGAEIVTLRPDQAGSGGIPPLCVNIFLYEIRPNLAWRNADLPTRNVNGQLTQSPRAALELHYLFTFYGNEQFYESQRLLGSVLRVLHARPMLTRALLHKAIADEPHIAGSNLDKQEELVRLTPLPMSTEELSRVWSVLLQTRYVLSVAFQASPVLIETDDLVAAQLPARTANLYALPLRQPAVERVIAASNPDLPIVAGDRIALVGQRLSGPITRVHVGSSEILPTHHSDTRIEFTLPPDLRAGVLGTRVRHDFPLGTPPVPHRGFESNMAAFVLHPTIMKNAGVYDVTVDRVEGAGTNPRSAEISARVSPVVGMNQTVMLELLTPAAVIRMTPAVARIADSHMVQFTVRDIVAGEYLVRVRVDGAESPLDVDKDPASATFNQPMAPKVTIP